ncbi:hypothetical protein LNP25_20690 [Klebsiella variicola subsp. variicola]|nr:hypothetical protein [Klebsiella variicola subsp. variicola]
MDTNNFYGTDSDYDKSTTDSGTLRFEHDLTDNTTVRNTTRWSRVKQEYLLTAVMGGASNITAPDINDVNTWSWSRLVNTKDVSNRILTNQTNITSTFNTGSIGHDVSAGVEFTRENQTNYGVNAADRAGGESLPSGEQPVDWRAGQKRSGMPTARLIPSGFMPSIR